MQSEMWDVYPKLDRKYHPDVSKASGAEERSKAISEAYEVLTDSEKREKCDRYGVPWKEMAEGGKGFGGCDVSQHC